ncbi:MAG: acyltransferase domain-containing protein [Symploca sp. SIO1B1]|nr:acyltransferase domain-containing protein [Symploca sp. SIO1B1]
MKSIKKSRKELVAIIGMAGIFPQAKDLQTYWQNILTGVDCITDVPPSRWEIEDYYDPNPLTPDKTYCKRGGFMPDVDFNALEWGIPPNILELTDVEQLLSLVIAKQALQDAGYENAAPSIRQRTGVVLGVGGGQKILQDFISRLQYPIWEKVLKSSGLSVEDTQKIIEKIKLAYRPWKENSFPGLLGNVISGRVANRLDLGGMNCVVDAACASSLSALRMALSELTEYRSDMMITGGIDTDNSYFMYMCFSKTPAFSLKGEIRPFDTNSDGMLIGEGLGMLVLKRLEDAQRDGDKIYAVIKGMGTSSDGKYKSIYAPRASGQAIALRRAYQDAEVAPQTVGLIEAHGTGTMAGDPTEFAALNEVFSENNPHQQYIALGSVKSQIGHTKAAAGVASLIKVALSLHHKILPPTINISQPNSKLKIEKSPFYLNTKTRPWLLRDSSLPRRAGVSSFGFGGTNFHVVLEEYQEDNKQPLKLHKSFDSLLISAPTTQKLLDKCQAILKEVQSKNRDNYYQELITASQNITIPRLSARVGFVTQDLTEAIKLLTTTINYLSKNITKEFWEHPEGIFYRKTGIDTQGKVVALFSGQGSQYLEMGKNLTINFTKMRQAFELMDDTLAEDHLTPISQILFPPPVFTKIEKKQQSFNLNQTENAQPAIGAFQMGLYNILQEAGFKADFVAGHSVGELTALWAAKVLSDKDYCFLIKSRGQAIASPLETNFDTGKMLAIKGDIQQIKSIIDKTPNVIIANYNSLEQVVIAGVSPVILATKEKLDKLGFTTILLPVSAAFHTSLVGHAQTAFAEAIKKVKFDTAQIPVYSNTTADIYPSNAENIQRILIDHIIHPVYFKNEIENIYNAGGNIFIEFGSKDILTKLVKNILGDRPYIAVALNQSSKKDDSEQSISNKYFRQAIIKLRVIGLNLVDTEPHQLPTVLTEKTTKKGLNITLNTLAYVSKKHRKAFEDALQDGYKIQEINQTGNDTLDSNHLEQEKLINSNITSQVNDSQKDTNLSSSDELLKDSEFLCQNEQNYHNSTLSYNNNKIHGQVESLPSAQANRQIKIMQNSNQNHQIETESFERILMRFYDHQAEVLNVHDRYLKSQVESSEQFFKLMQQQYAPLSPDDEAKLIPKSQLREKTTPQSLTAKQEFISNKIEQNLREIDSQEHNESLTSDNLKIIEETSLAQKYIQEVKTQVLSQAELDSLSRSLLEIVSDKTGYPSEMLELEMDMESDLGIDSIKRVEILGSMQELYPDMPPVNPEELAELRTLAQIVDYMGRQSTEDEKKTLTT